MIRSLTGLLIIAVIFLAGMVVGIGKEDKDSIGDSVKLLEFNPDFQADEPEELKPEDEHLDTTAKQEKPDSPKHVTQIVASSLESVVKGFYDLIVQLCYAFANLFFN